MNSVNVQSTLSKSNVKNVSQTQPGEKGDMSKKMSQFVKDNKFLLIFIGVVLLIFIIVIIYIYFAMKGTGLQAKSLTSAPIKLTQSNSPQTINTSLIPVPSLGKEYAYSFWVYLENYDQTSANQRMLWYRGNLNDIATANPLIYMDSASNKMYLCVKTQNSTLSSTTVNYNQDVGQVVANNYFLNKSKFNSPSGSNQYLIMTIDYVPLQKWVNVVLIVDNQMISVYLDGEMYSVKSIDDFNAMNPITYNLIVDKTDGDIFIGANPQSSKNITINGYLSKLDFFTYAMSAMDVKKIYDAGPFSRSFMSMIGLGSSYGVRSPVYKIGSGDNQ